MSKAKLNILLAGAAIAVLSSAWLSEKYSEASKAVSSALEEQSASSTSGKAVASPQLPSPQQSAPQPSVPVAKQKEPVPQKESVEKYQPQGSSVKLIKAPMKEDFVKKLGKFDGLSVDGSFDVKYEVSDKERSVFLAAPDGYHKFVSLENRNGTLHVSFTGENQNGMPLIIWQKGPALSKVVMQGSGRVTIPNVSQQDVSVHMLGSGMIALAGTVNASGVKIAGSGLVDLSALKSKNTRVEIMGSGEARVFTSQVADFSIMGSGTIREMGTPSVKQVAKFDTGRVEFVR